MKRRRLLFWIVFVITVSLGFALIIPGSVRRHRASQSAAILSNVLSSDRRFSNVHAAYGTQGMVYLDGQVDSAEDLSALMRVIQEARLPSQPAWSVTVHAPDSQGRP